MEYGVLEYGAVGATEYGVLPASGRLGAMEYWSMVGRRPAGATEYWSIGPAILLAGGQQEGYNAVCLHKWLDADSKLCYCNTYLKLGKANGKFVTQASDACHRMPRQAVVAILKDLRREHRENR